MSELENLVPPRGLCKMIPEGAFADSALIWMYDGQDWWVNAREFDASYDEAHPAPTLAEIMAEIVKLKDLRGLNNHVYLKWDREAWRADCWDDGYHVIEMHDIANAATAALKLWLELKGAEE